MKYITTLCLLLFTITAFAQDPMLQSNNEQLEEKADAITEQYVEELAMGSKQELLFKKKVEEFLIRAEKIKAQYEGEEMLTLLVALHQQETKEMGDILTRPQLNKYKKIKLKIQPLARVGD